jgi:hypothetical protein
MWNRIALPPVILLLASAQVLTAQYLHPKLKSKERAVHSISVVPPKIDETGGKSDKYRAEELARKLDENVSDALQKRGREVKAALTDEKRIAALQALYESVSGKLDGDPKGVGKAAFTLGADIAKQTEAMAVDALVFVRADAVFESKVSASAEPGSFSITETPRNKVKARFVLVDAKTGDVLYYFTANGKGDNPSTFAALEKGVTEGLRNLPD